MIRAVGQCLESQNETGARQVFDVLETLLILVSPVQWNLCVSSPDSMDLGNPSSKP
jgi:hypothetical protein